MATELESLQSTLAGRYAVERELGRGGMGIVFLARDLTLVRRALGDSQRAIAQLDDRRRALLDATAGQ